MCIPWDNIFSLVPTSNHLLRSKSNINITIKKNGSGGRGTHSCFTNTYCLSFSKLLFGNIMFSKRRACSFQRLSFYNACIITDIIMHLIRGIYCLLSIYIFDKDLSGTYLKLSHVVKNELFPVDKIQDLSKKKADLHSFR